MKKIILVLALISAFFSVEGRKLRHHTHGSENYNAQRDSVPAPFQFFTQKLTHFDAQDRRTWSQRYLVNDTLWDGKGPVFFMMNGEEELDPYSVVDYQYCFWAKEFKALLISLEHRFYGQSYPLGDLSLQSLKYLSSEQALADAAYFRQFIADKYNAHNNQFITFGGSYAGELSGWMRVKYPHLIDASVASSAPVNAVVDFYQYLEVVQNSLIYYGSTQCVANIAAATQSIQALTKDASGLALLSRTFNTCAPITQKDIANFMDSLSESFREIVQYNLEGVHYNVSKLCDIMTNPQKDPVSNYVDVWNLSSDNKCSDVSYENSIASHSNTSIPDPPSIHRQWAYQYCVEFGFLQTTSSTKQPFGNLITLSYELGFCHDIFGFNFMPDANWTNIEYGANKPQGSNILWVNGNIDPWHALSVLEAPEGSPYKVLVINGTAHCADMDPPRPYSPPALAPAQEVIRQQLATWIANFNAAKL